MYECKYFCMYVHIYESIYLTKNTPDVKKGSQELKPALQKDKKSNGRPWPPDFDSLKVLVMMTSLHNIVISGAYNPLMLMGSKLLIKMTRPQNIKIKRTMVYDLVIFIKNFNPIIIRRPWAPEIMMFCSEVIMTKTHKPRRPWLSIWFQIFFSKASFNS